MAVYFCYLFLICAQVPFFHKRNGLGKRQFHTQAYVFLCCLEIILLAGFRGYAVGADTVTYLDAFRYYSQLPVLDLITAPLVAPFDFEIGYFALTKFCAFWGMNETLFLFVIAIIIYIPVFRAIQRYSSAPYLSILAYFAFGLFSYSLGIFRQMIAASILLCGWGYVRERKVIRYLIVVGVAMLFHTSAIIALGLYFLCGINWKKILWFVFPAEIFLLIFGRKIVLLAVKLLPQYAGYVDGQYDVQGGSYLMLLLLNVVLITCVVLYQKGRYRDKVTICALILAVLIQALGYSMAIFGRMIVYFSTYLIFAIPGIVCGMSQKWRKPVELAVVALLLLLTYRELHGNKFVTPYEFFWNTK